MTGAVDDDGRGSGTTADEVCGGNASSPCTRRRATLNPRVARERLSSARALRRRARRVAEDLDMRLLTRLAPTPPAHVQAVRELHRSATDWLLIEGALSRWAGP